MATTPSPLIWDFSREIATDASEIGVSHYFDEDAQSLYLKNGNLYTKTYAINEGHWSESVLSDEIKITDGHLFSKIRLDHPINGTLYFVGLEDGHVVFLRYVYGYELTNIINSWDLSSQSDSPIDQMSLSIDNIDSDIFTDESSLFNPGSRVPIKIRFGDSELLQMGLSWIDEVDYTIGSDTVPMSGRNTIGCFLKDQTIDEDVTKTDTDKNIAEWLVNKAGIKKYNIQNLNKNRTFDFQASTDILSAITNISTIFNVDEEGDDYGVLETADGTVLIGSSEFRSTIMPNSAYEFTLGKDIFSRATTKNSDAAYTHLRTTGTVKVTDYNSLTSYKKGDVVRYNTPEYDESTDYDAGEFVKYSGMYFSALRNIRRGWDSQYWRLLVVPEDEKYKYETVGQFTNTKDYVVGDYVKNFNDLVYICIKDRLRVWDARDWYYVGQSEEIYECIEDVNYGKTTLRTAWWKYKGDNKQNPIFTEINTFPYWSLNGHKTKHISAPYEMTYSEFNHWSEKQKEAFQYTGITEKFTGPFRPQLLVGDVAKVKNGDAVSSLGIITDIRHSFSKTEGFKTDFSVDSGGVETDGSGYIIYTKTARVDGYNRKQKISDLIKIISK